MVHPHYVIKTTEEGAAISHYHPPHQCTGCAYCSAGVPLEGRPFALNSNSIPGILVLTGWTLDEEEVHVKTPPMG